MLQKTLTALAQTRLQEAVVFLTKQGFKPTNDQDINQNSSRSVLLEKNIREHSPDYVLIGITTDDDNRFKVWLHKQLYMDQGKDSGYYQPYYLNTQIWNNIEHHWAAPNCLINFLKKINDNECS
jgi:hypothetical protein